VTGITFGDKHSYEKYGLKLFSSVTEGPEARKEMLPVPGRHGQMDLSQSLTGDVVYDNRTLTYGFDLYAPTLDDYEARMQEIRNGLDGRMLRVYPDAEPGFHYVGRLAVSSEYDTESMEQEVYVTVDAEPFRYRNAVTVVNAVLTGDGGQDVLCPNLRKWAVPTITTNAETQVAFEGVNYSLAAGVHIVPGIILKDGDNILTCTGTGTIKFEYQEGAL